MAKVTKTEVASILAKQKKDVKEKEHKMSFVFTRQKYIIMLIGLGLILVGFLLMIGGGSEDPNTFSKELFSFRRLTLAPILVILGFVVEIYAIMKKPKGETEPITKNDPA